MDVFEVDFAKAFDFTLHRKLLYKLKIWGICDKIYSWIKEFCIISFF